MNNDMNITNEWRGHALKIKQDANKIILGQEKAINLVIISLFASCLLYTSPSPRDRTRSRMPSSA